MKVVKWDLLRPIWISVFDPPAAILRLWRLERLERLERLVGAGSPFLVTFEDCEWVIFAQSKATIHAQRTITSPQGRGDYMLGRQRTRTKQQHAWTKEGHAKNLGLRFGTCQRRDTTICGTSNDRRRAM